MATIKLYHGSDHIIEKPSYALGKPNNDYGKGFYCTEDIEMAKEWACKENKNGFVNAYDFDPDGLNVLNLLDGKHSILNWIALLLENRIFSLQEQIAFDARDYLIRNFSLDLSQCDAVIGYRADDSYFSYAHAFLSNALPLRSLGEALFLGKLGSQFALVSKRSFERISFAKAVAINKEEYYAKYISRDLRARSTYQKKIKKRPTYQNDIFVMDILRQRMKNDDPRIQRIVLK